MLTWDSPDYYMYKNLKTKRVYKFSKIILGIPGFPFISVEFHLPVSLLYLPVEKMLPLLGMKTKEQREEH